MRLVLRGVLWGGVCVESTESFKWGNGDTGVAMPVEHLLDDHFLDDHFDAMGELNATMMFRVVR